MYNQHEEGTKGTMQNCKRHYVAGHQGRCCTQWDDTQRWFYKSQQFNIIDFRGDDPLNQPLRAHRSTQSAAPSPQIHLGGCALWLGGRRGSLQAICGSQWLSERDFAELKYCKRSSVICILCWCRILLPFCCCCCQPWLCIHQTLAQHNARRVCSVAHRSKHSRWS